MPNLLCGECIAAMPTAEFAIACGIALVLAAMGLLRARHHFARARLIEDMPTSRVRSASQGYVELVGLAADHGDPRFSPLTATPCLWWRYTVERYERRGKRSSWRTIRQARSRAPFYLDDGTGQCRIEPVGAEISCLHRKVWYGNSPHPAAGPSHGLAALTPIGFGQRYRYTEYLLRAGDPLYVLGHFVSDRHGAQLLTLDQVSGQLISEWKGDFDNLLVGYDSDGNGHLDELEWGKVRADARQQALSQRHNGSGPDAEVVRPADSRLPYLIGSYGQEHLSHRHRLRAAGFALLFLVAGTAATWLIANRIG